MQLGWLPKGERGYGGPLRPFADEHRSRRGGGLKARRDVDGIAGHHWPVGANLRGSNHLTGVDADSQRELDSVAALDVGRDFADAADDRGGGAQRPRCVVLADERHRVPPRPVGRLPAHQLLRQPRRPRTPAGLR